MSSAEVKTLDESQLVDFDWEFVGENKRAIIADLIERQFGDRTFRFMDIGGGNGVYVDWMLERFPLSEGVVLDNSSTLLSKNKPHPRKQTVLGSATDLHGSVEGRFDVMSFNYVLHHLVTDSYRETRKMQVDALRQAVSMLAPGGRISIVENIYDGAVFKGLPSYLIYQLTSLKTLAPVIRRLGANTAGVGVCFLGKQQWLKGSTAAGLQCEHYVDHGTLNISMPKRALLHLGHIRSGHFWCRASQVS